MAKLNIADVRDLGIRSIERVYLSTTKQRICLRRLSVVEITRRFRIYEDIVRKSQLLFNVQVYRNKSCIDEGIYIAGRENFVEEYIKWISRVISRIEKDTFEFGNPIKNWSKVHGNASYSTYAHKLAKKVLNTVIDLVLYKDKTYTEMVMGQCILDYNLTSTYCNDLSILKNKTKYNGELRHTGPEDGRTKK